MERSIERIGGVGNFWKDADHPAEPLRSSTLNVWRHAKSRITFRDKFLFRNVSSPSPLNSDGWVPFCGASIQGEAKILYSGGVDPTARTNSVAGREMLRTPRLLWLSLFLDGKIRSGVIRTIPSSGDELSGCRSCHSDRFPCAGRFVLRRLASISLGLAH